MYGSAGAHGRVTTIITVLALSLLLVACKSQPRHPMLEETGARLVFDGFSFQPPREKGWIVIKKGNDWVALAKKGAAVDETYAIQASLLMKLPEFKNDQEFLRFSRRAFNNDSDGGRFQILKSSDRLVKGKRGNCVKFYTQSRDKDPLTRSRRKGSMILEIMGFTCLHPQDRKKGVIISHSKRYFPGQKTERITERSWELFRSLAFEKL
jgi:hypothetical protein